MKIRFLGAVKGVTGSNHLIEAGGKNIMLDCGMYQGKDEDLNEKDFVINPAEIDCLLLSHSHIDHSGRIPLLVKEGFKGNIYCSKPTYDLCQIMLVDSAHIQETEAEWTNKKAMRSGKELVEPIYTQEDALASLKYFKPVLNGQIININENIAVKFSDAGHILGSSIIEFYIMKGDNPLYFKNLHYIQSAEESKALNFSNEPKIIITASGMCEAGRIRHHLKHNLWRKEASVVFVGYQAEGTLGRRLLDGEKTVKLFGEDIAVKAEIYNVEGFSGHADKPALLNWLGDFKEKPGKVFIVHGEKEAKEEFAQAVREKFGIETIIPEYNVVYDIRKKDLVKVLVLESEQEKLRDRQIQELLMEVEDLKKAFERALANTEEYLKLEDVNYEDIKKLNNNIKSLENEIMNLTMISAK